MERWFPLHDTKSNFWNQECTNRTAMVVMVRTYQVVC